MRNPKVTFDNENGLHYIITEGIHKLYFKRGMSIKSIKQMYNVLCLEQDELSPHNYCFDTFPVTSDSILADIGASEGLFCLKFIDKIKALYLFECDKGWQEALEATFKPWKEKTYIISKYVSNKNEGDFITLDYYFQNKNKPTLLKIDTDGYESEVLEGADSLIDNISLNDILVCTYHKKGDAEKLSALLTRKHYKITFSRGYMLYLWEVANFDLEYPYDFRKGLIHASLL
jgi:hypothetical protein